MAVRAAVVGVGYLGKFHAEKYSQAEDTTLVAVVDRDATKANEQATKLSCQPLTDYHELKALAVQCVSVVSDTSTHHEVSKWCLENGIDVLVEKPIATTKEQALDLIKTAERHQRILQVGHLERFNPAFRATKDLLTMPRFFEARRIAPFSGRAFDVDVVLDLMIHDIDIIAHLVGKPIQRVEAVGIPVLTGTVDIANARLYFEGGAIANVTASRAASHAERTIKIFQPNVYISIDYGNKKLKIYNRLNEKDERGFNKINMSEHPVEARDALRDEINSFLQCVRTRSRPEVPGEDGLRALELADLVRATVASSVAEYESLVSAV